MCMCELMIICVCTSRDCVYVDENVCVCGENVLEQWTVRVKTRVGGGASQARPAASGPAAPR